MKISVMGLGYVGTVSAACLAQEGHEVIGVDTGQLKVDLVNAGRTPVIEQDLGAILPSNEQQIERGVQAVIEKGSKKVGILGFSFKAGTDDLRESPIVELAERLIGKGYDLRMYDSNVRLAAIHGANRDYILNRVPHISRLMVSSIDEVLDHAGTIVIGNAAPEFRDVPKRLGDGQTIVDFVRISESRSISGVYEGICW